CLAECRECLRAALAKELGRLFPLRERLAPELRDELFKGRRVGRPATIGSDQSPGKYEDRDSVHAAPRVLRMRPGLRGKGRLGTFFGVGGVPRCLFHLPAGVRQPKLPRPATIFHIAPIMVARPLGLFGPSKSNNYLIVISRPPSPRILNQTLDSTDKAPYY